jgi:hypothetical protein
VLRAVAAELESEGIAVVESTLFLKEIVPEAGVLGARTPTDEEWRDIRFGFRAAKVIGQFDIGQSVVVRNGCVLAVEGIEGHRCDDPPRGEARERRRRGRQGVQADAGHALRPAAGGARHRADHRGGRRPGAGARGRPHDHLDREEMIALAGRRGDCGRGRRDRGRSTHEHRPCRRRSAWDTSGASTPRSTARRMGPSWSASADVDAARAREVASALGVQAFTDHRELLGRVDCASVAVPTQFHHAVARDLLEGGVDVLGREAAHVDARRGEAARRAGGPRRAASCRWDTSSASIRRSSRSKASCTSRASSSAIAWRHSPSAAPTSTSSSTS